MSTVTDYAKCKQCGYGESRERVLADDGSGVGWKHKNLDGHGAMRATRLGSGVSMFLGLRSAQEVEQAVQKIRDSIAKGELDGEQSYVTKWDAPARSVEVVAGKWCETGKSVQ